MENNEKKPFEVVKPTIKFDQACAWVEKILDKADKAIDDVDKAIDGPMDKVHKIKEKNQQMDL